MYKVTRRLVVRKRKQRERIMRGQCFLSQNYKHTQAYYKIVVKCVNGEESRTVAECSRPSEIPATCVLNEKAHPANYRRCEPPSTTRKVTLKEDITLPRGQSFASVVGQQPLSTRRGPRQEEFPSVGAKTRRIPFLNDATIISIDGALDRKQELESMAHRYNLDVNELQETLPSTEKWFILKCYITHRNDSKTYKGGTEIQVKRTAHNVSYLRLQISTKRKSLVQRKAS